MPNTKQSVVCKRPDGTLDGILRIHPILLIVTCDTSFLNATKHLRGILKWVLNLKFSFQTLQPPHSLLQKRESLLNRSSCPLRQPSRSRDWAVPNFSEKAVHLLQGLSTLLHDTATTKWHRCLVDTQTAYPELSQICNIACSRQWGQPVVVQEQGLKMFSDTHTQWKKHENVHLHLDVVNTSWNSENVH